MNDRYLFRAKRIDNGEWAEGFYVYNDKHYIGELCTEHNVVPAISWHEVDKSTICQCTGLKDKNGKLIWENDIVKPFADLKGIVRFGERDYSREFGFNIEWMSESCYRRDFLYWAENARLSVQQLTIDDPELLEQQGW